MPPLSTTPVHRTGLACGGRCRTLLERSFDSSGELWDCTVVVEPGGGTEHAVDGFDSTGTGGPFSFGVHQSRLTAPEAAVHGSSTFAIGVGASP